MRAISVVGFISMSDNSPGVVLQFADETTGTTIMLDVKETEALIVAMPKALAQAWELVAKEAQGESVPAVDDSCPILPPDADKGKCSINLTPGEIDEIVSQRGGLGNPPKASQSELVKEDGFDSEDGRSC